MLGRIREEQRDIFDAAAWAQLDRTRQVEAMRGLVERIGYDGAARQICIRFHAAALAAGETKA